ncbi:MAG: hypothetical protein [Bacteriophage sp.]|nr:MAG: hypothetical protein [Bacteriophage sp.]
MKREEIKSYKDACKVIGRKPRTYKDKHLNLYEQLSTIIAALNFISNDNKPWTPKFNYCCIYSLCSDDGLVVSCAPVGTSLKIKERKDGNYIIENFKELLQDWFWGD